jgi:CHASE3 domain sensor protein
MDENERLELQRKHKEETSAMLRRVLIIGGIKLAVLSVISAVFVYWYMYS